MTDGLHTFFVAGTPKPQPRPRAFAFQGHARVYDAHTAEGWKSSIADAARPHCPSEATRGPVTVNMEFRFARPKHHFGMGRNEGVLKSSAPEQHLGRPDLDNLAKAVLDAMTELGFWRDDSQVVRMMVTKRYDDRPGVEVIVRIASDVAMPVQT